MCILYILYIYELKIIYITLLNYTYNEVKIFIKFMFILYYFTFDTSNN